MINILLSFMLQNKLNYFFPNFYFKYLKIEGMNKKKKKIMLSSRESDSAEMLMALP
jgi:uncharacterized membrane protein YobD (UPF0266 family)